jgi:hypothetical protein
MPHYEEKKAIIAKRVQERKKQREAEEEAAPEVLIELTPQEDESVMDRVINAIVDDEVLDEVVEAEYEAEDAEGLEVMPFAEEDEGLLSLDQVFKETFEEAYGAYCGGIEFESNPYIHEGMSEDADDPDVVLAEVWQDGWIAAHTDACMANLVLVAKKMVETEDDEEIIKLYDELTDAVEVLGEVLDFDNYTEHWQEIIG